ncbi:MAG: insulinase family protein [Prevotella sp.]|nr:insulinase family protein [Prevotella sp.]
MKYNTHTLPCGMRIIHRQEDGGVVYCGIGIAAGARDELQGEEGLAHFCEHATFKGTSRRRAWHILNCLESVGGDLNAFTNKSDTVYHAAVPREHALRAIDLLTDIVFHSVYPDSEIDREKEVICDEIESYNDSPAELIYDEIDNILFEHAPLGHNILGTAESVRRFGSTDARRFTQRNYRPEQTILFVAGNVNFQLIVRQMEKAMAAYPCSTPITEQPTASAQLLTPTAHQGETIEQRRDTHQAHVVVATGTYTVFNDRRLPLFLLNNMVGGPGMNALFNINLRERHGLVYSVESSMSTWDNAGAWYTYFGCDHHDIDRCLRLIRKDMDRLMDEPVSETRLKAAKRQMKGQMQVAGDNRQSTTLDFAYDYLHLGREKDFALLAERIDAITADDLQSVARDVFNPDRLTTLIFK